MFDAAYDDISLEKIILNKFSVKIKVENVIVRNIPVSMTAEATLFLNEKKQLLLFINTRSRAIFSDIKKIVSRMGLKADYYFPPLGRKNYFNQIGINKFREVFPGRVNISDSDIAFYKTLAPYQTALVLISEVRNGKIYQYDNDSNTKWRIATKFTYRRIPTSQ